MYIRHRYRSSPLAGRDVEILVPNSSDKEVVLESAFMLLAYQLKAQPKSRHKFLRWSKRRVGRVENLRGPVENLGLRVSMRNKRDKSGKFDLFVRRAEPLTPDVAFARGYRRANA